MLMDEDPMATDDELLSEVIEQALEPYRAVLRSDELDDLRAVMTDTLTTHPVTVRVLAAIRPAPDVASSGEVDVDGSSVDVPKHAEHRGGRP
jgi:hypothetical protein